MIVGSSEPRTIGQRYVGITDAKRYFYEAPYVVLREASFEEWEKDCLEDGMSRADVKYDIYLNAIQGAKAYFYEVSVD